MFHVKHRLPAAAFIVAAVYVPPDLLFSGTFMPHWWAMALLLPWVSRLDPRALDPRIGACLLAGIAWAAISLAWTIIPAEGTMDLIFLMLLALAMLAGANAEPEELDRALAGFGWGIAISAPVSIAQALGYTVGPPTYHPAGLFFNSEIMGLAAAAAFVWAARSARYALAVATFIPLALSNSRVSFAAAGVGILFGWLPECGRAIKTAVIVGGGAAMGGIFWLASIGFPIGRLVTGLSRVVIWIAGIENITPLGGGLGWWPVAFPGPLEEYAHSDILQFAVELGAGSLFLLAVPVMIWRKGAGDVAQRSAFVCLVVEAAVSFPTHLPATGFMAALLAGGMARRGDRICRGERAGRSRNADDLRWATAHRARVVSAIPLGTPRIPF